MLTETGIARTKAKCSILEDLDLSGDDSEDESETEQGKDKGNIRS